MQKVSSGDVISVGHDPSPALGGSEKMEMFSANAGKAVCVDQIEVEPHVIGGTEGYEALNDEQADTKSARTPVGAAIRVSAHSAQTAERTATAVDVLGLTWRMGQISGALRWCLASHARHAQRFFTYKVFPTFIRISATAVRQSTQEPNRRGWVAARKHLPNVDVVAAGGWKDVQKLKECYQQQDLETMLEVVHGVRALKERRA